MGGYSGPKNASRTATSRFETYEQRADAACKEEGSTLLVVLSFLLFLAII